MSGLVQALLWTVGIIVGYFVLRVIVYNLSRLQAKAWIDEYKTNF